MKHYLLIILIFGSIQAFAQNPISTYYTTDYNNGETAPVWTEKIKWNVQINMATYSNGSNDFEKFENARDQLYTQGGGVLYYPAGIYDFKDIPHSVTVGGLLVPNKAGRGLMLKKGVVILGAAPTSDKDAVIGKKPEDYPLAKIGVKTDMAPEVSNDRHGLNTLTTIFRFPYYQRKDANGDLKNVPTMWNFVGIMPGVTGIGISEASEVGIAWVNFDGAGVYFGPDYNSWRPKSGVDSATEPNQGWQSRYMKSFWNDRKPDGTHWLDPFTGLSMTATNVYIPSKNRFIFGCRFDNSTVTNMAHKYYSTYPDSAYATDRYSGRLGIYGSNVLVANNVISQPTNCFKYTQYLIPGKYNPGCLLCLTDPANATVTTIFDYAYSIGIDVNKSLASFTTNLKLVDESQPWYQPNVIIRDNWVFSHGDKGMDVAGKYMVVKNNRIFKARFVDWYSNHTPKPFEDVYNLESLYPNHKGWSMTYEGFRHPRANDDFMTRGFDIGGHIAWFDNNWVRETHTYSKQAPVNDGEGILCQRNGEVEALSYAFTDNYVHQVHPNYDARYPYILIYDTHALGAFFGWNRAGDEGIGFGRKTNPFPNYISDYSYAENYHWNGTPKPQGQIISRNNAGNLVMTITDTVLRCPGSNPDPVTNLTAIPFNNEAIKIEWTDESDSELAFRIDRKTTSSTNWVTIAYRPKNAKNEVAFPNATGSQFSFGPNINVDFNEQSWIDYTAQNGVIYDYRVISVKCRGALTGNDSGAVNEIDSVGPVSNLAIHKEFGYVSVAPNPSSAITILNISDNNSGLVNVEILDVNGKACYKNVFEKSSKVFSKELNLSLLHSGIYLIRIGQENQYRVLRFVKL